jgi:hypothetical protein
MLSFAPTVTVESLAEPGVQITVRRLSKIERAELELELLDTTLRNTEIAEQMADLRKPYPWPKDDEGNELVGQRPPGMPAGEWLRYLRLDHELGSLINARVKPATVRRGFVSLSGMDYAGDRPTADLLIEHGPDGLLDEIYVLIEANKGLSAEQAKNWHWPSISAAVEAPAVSDLTAANASLTAGTDQNDATAAVTSQTT